MVAGQPNDARTAALLVLQDHKTVPATQLAEVAEEHGDPLALARERCGEDADEQIAAAAEQLERWRGEGISVLTVFDDTYPENLRSVHDRPAVLYLRGTLQPERDTRSVAVVGTRQATPQGLRRAGKLAADLRDSGYVVVSGLAAGIDTAAHQAALLQGGRTVAVIGTGHHHAFPKHNAELQELIAREHAVISQFRPGQGPTRWTFPMRNAVMSGFAKATVVVEASKTSGARTQAKLALKHGRPVFLLQSLVDTHDWAAEMAGRGGVHVITSTADVIDQLGAYDAGTRQLGLLPA